MITINKRTKFTLLTIFYIFSLMLFEFFVLDLLTLVQIYLLLFFSLNLLVLYPGFRKSDVLLISYFPLIITVATILGLVNFPNLFSLFKYSLILFSGGLFYVSLLINNLIIAEKVEDRSLPLFRVGLVWVQILIIILSIPFLTGIYKLDLKFYEHSFLVFLYLFCSSHVYLHTLLISKGSDFISKREYLLLIFQASYLPTVISLGVSLFESETFLRATLITSVYMGMISYLRNYIENSLNKKLLWQYGLICCFFLITFFLFAI